MEQAKSGGRSELEPIQSDPEVRFRLSFLLDIEALVPARAGRWGSSPQGWLPSELLAELLGRPYLSGLHVRFNTRRAEHGFPACNDNGPITLTPTRQHFAIVQSDPQARLARARYTSSMMWRPARASATGSSWTMNTASPALVSAHTAP